MSPHFEAPLFSVLIPARDEEKCIGRCIHAVEESWRDLVDACGISGNFEIVVIANRCTDRTEEIASAVGARVIRNDAKNLATIRNAGAAAARGKYLVTVDADSFMSKGMLRCIYDALKDKRTIGGGVLMVPERWSLGIAATCACLLPIALWYGISGGMFFFSRADFEAIGGFDESLSSAEDIDFAMRLKRFGRTQGKRFRHILRAYIVTSCRKFDVLGDWYFIKHPGVTIKLLRGRNQELANKIWYDFER